MGVERLKRLFVAAGFGCTAALAVVSAAPISASAANGQTVTLTSAQTVALFGSTIQCQYLTRPGGVDTWETGQFTYLVTENWASLSSYNGTGYQYYSPDGQDFSDRQICLYGMSYPADLSISANSVAMLKLQTAVDISAVDYLDTAIIQNTGSSSLLDIDSTPYAGLGVNFLHTDFGNFDMLRRGASGTTEYNYAGFVRNSIGVKCTITPIYLNSNSLQAASIGWAQCSCIRNSDNRIIIGIVTPILSADWVLDGNTGAGEGSSNVSGSDSGGGSGSGSVDLSGVEDALDLILDKLDQIISNTAASGSVDGSSSQNAADQSVVNSAAASQNSAYQLANSYNDNVYEVADLESLELPDMENSYGDLPNDFQNFWYIDGNATFFTLMVILSGSIAVIAFIIFGKTF